MTETTSTNNQSAMGRAQRRKLKRFEQRLLTALSYHPNAELYRSELMKLKASISRAEWDEHLADIQSFLKRKREENLELIGDATSPQAVSEVRLLIESKQDPWAYRYPASDSFKASTGRSHVVVTCRDGFLSVIGVSIDA